MSVIFGPAGRGNLMEQRTWQQRRGQGRKRCDRMGDVAFRRYRISKDGNTNEERRNATRRRVAAQRPRGIRPCTRWLDRCRENALSKADGKRGKQRKRSTNMIKWLAISFMLTLTAISS